MAKTKTKKVVKATKTKKAAKATKKIKKTVKKAVKKTVKKSLKKVEEKVVKPSKNAEISLQELLEAGCHFGHRKSKTHPKIKPYIYAVRNEISIFDLAKTKEKILEAQKFITDLTEKGKKIVFIGTKRQAREIVKKAAKEVGMPFIVRRWLGGTITNWQEIRSNSVNKYKTLKSDWESGKFSKRTKREQAVFKRELGRLERLVGGLVDLDKIFDAIIVVDVKGDKVAVDEARTAGIPIIGIVDSNCSPDLVDYPIPANDDAAKSIQLIIGELAKAVKN